MREGCKEQKRVTCREEVVAVREEFRREMECKEKSCTAELVFLQRKLAKWKI